MFLYSLFIRQAFWTWVAMVRHPCASNSNSAALKSRLKASCWLRK